MKEDFVCLRFIFLNFFIWLIKNARESRVRVFANVFGVSESLESVTHGV